MQIKRSLLRYQEIASACVRLRPYASGFFTQIADFNNRCATTPIRLGPYASVCVRLKPGPLWGYFGGILGPCEIRRYPQLRSVAHSRILKLVQRRAPALP